MADTLFPAAAGLAESASRGASELSGQKIQMSENADRNLTAVGSQAEETNRARENAIAQQKIEQMKIAAGQIDVDPEIAMGLAKNTGNPGYLKMVGHKIPTKALFGMYTNDMKMSVQKEKESSTPPKTFKAYDKTGKETTYEHVQDENGNWTVQPIGGGKAPTPPKPRGGGGAKDPTEQKKKDAADLLVKIQKSTDEAGKKSLIASYNTYASDKTLGLIPYTEEPGFFEKAKAALGSVVDTAESIVKKNHKEQPSASDSVASKFGF